MNKNIEELLSKYQQYKLSEIIDYDKFNSYAIVHHSTSIEGSTLSLVETRLLLDENLTPKGKPLEHTLMTKDHYAALQFIRGEAKAKTQITPAFIQAINSRVMKSTGKIYQTVFGEIDASKGMFRKGNVSAGQRYFVNFDKVEALIAELCKKITGKLKTDTTILEKLDTSFTAHFDLVTIHPFYDGNGRTSRLLMNYIQAIYNLPLAIVFKEDKAEYFTALEETRKHEDISIFKAFMYDQYSKYLQEEITKYEEVLNDKGKNLPRGDGYSLIF